jgi:hypothetical protein
MISYETFVRELHDELSEADPCGSALCSGIGEDRVRVMLRDGTEHFFCGRYALEIDPADPVRRLYIRHRYTGEVEACYTGDWVYAFVERSPLFVRPGPIDEPNAWIIESTVPNRDENSPAYITGAIIACKSGWWSTIFLDVFYDKRILAVAGPHASFLAWHRDNFDEDEVSQDEGEVDA